MMDLAAPEMFEALSERRSGGGRSPGKSPSRSRGASATVAIPADEFRAELACGCQAGLDAQLEPYEEGFAAYGAGIGLLDNPYAIDNCAHQQWGNGWSQARDEAQRQAR